MASLTTKDKRLIAEHIHDYVQSGGDAEITLQAYQRAMQWSQNWSFQEIADEEGVSAQTISQSVRKVVASLKRWQEAES